MSDEPREDAPAVEEANPEAPARHDPRARPHRAPRPRQGARRARRGSPRRRRRSLKRIGRPLGDWTTPAADPRHQRRRHRVPRPPRPQAGARPDRRRHGRRAGLEPVRRRPPEDADAAAARPGADPRRRLDRLLDRRLPHRLRRASRSWASSRSASTSSRPGSTTAPTWATTSRTPGTVSAAMEAVINNCPGLRDQPGVRSRRSTSRWRPSRRRSSPATSWSTASSGASC